MFGITPQAAEAIRQSTRDHAELANLPLRVAARQHSDNTFEYVLGFDEPAVADVQVHSHGIHIVMAPAHAQLLEETTMDFGEIESGQMAFIFLNPLDANYTPAPADAAPSP